MMQPRDGCPPERFDVLPTVDGWLAHQHDHPVSSICKAHVGARLFPVRVPGARITKGNTMNSSINGNEILLTAQCLLGRIKEIQRYLRRKGFSYHAIEQAVTVLYRAAMPYINGTKICKIKNRRAWAFKVAIRAAVRAAKRQVRFKVVGPVELATMAKQPGRDEEAPFDICGALNQLTDKQNNAVTLCLLMGMSRRQAAWKMGIAVSTLCGHLSVAKERLKEILPEVLPSSLSKRFCPSAAPSYTVEGEKESALPDFP
jgi:DNA-directed RNA polymerase specialized sigma24 family protein